MTLNDELDVIDETIAELEGRRTDIINRMEVAGRPRTISSSNKVLSFPARSEVVVTSYKSARHVW
jgi:hypothetical protein